MLAAGIDVFSHGQRPAPGVAQRPGRRADRDPRPRDLPDAILGSADDVVLIDITPDSLLERLRAGKVYPPERVQSALQNFFKVENLTALREVSLRQVAEEIEAKRLPPPTPAAPGGPHPAGAGRDDERLLDTHAPSAIGERLLALITPQPRVAASRAPRLALGPAARGGARSAVGGAARAARRRESSSSRRCAGWPACSAPTCWSSTATTSPRSRPGSRASAAPPMC